MTPTEPNARAMNAAKLVAELNDIVSYHREMQQARRMQRQRPARHRGGEPWVTEGGP